MYPAENKGIWNRRGQEGWIQSVQMFYEGFVTYLQNLKLQCGAIWKYVSIIHANECHLFYNPDITAMLSSLIVLHQIQLLRSRGQEFVTAQFCLMI